MSFIARSISKFSFFPCSSFLIRSDMSQFPRTPNGILSLPKMSSGANTFEISDIHEDGSDASRAKRSECDNVTFGRKQPDGILVYHSRERASSGISFVLGMGLQSQTNPIAPPMPS